ncbi:MAG: hypothetical protein ABI193_07110 [Minicystis sp.]
MPRSPLRAALLRLVSAAFFASLVGASCGQRALGVMPGVINSPSNLSLRKAILSFGTSHVCAEVQKRSLPLKLRDDDPVIGRFFPGTCFAQDLASGDLHVQFSGGGYLWTNLTQRMSFDAGGAIDYDTDFQMDGSTMYVYFRPKSTGSAPFTIKLIEQPQAAAMSGSLFGGGGNVVNNVGAQILKGEIAKGFTVIRAANGDVEFGMGVVEKGSHPPAPFKGTDNMLANEMIEVHQGQRDFVGPLEVPSGGKLDIKVAIDGAPACDVLLVPRYIGEAWLQTYVTQAVTTAPPNPPLLDDSVFSGAVWHRTLSLPGGLYYLVLDNTATAGRTMPTTYARDDRAVLVKLAVSALD